MAPTADSGVVRVLDEYIRLQELYYSSQSAPLSWQFPCACAQDQRCSAANREKPLSELVLCMLAVLLLTFAYAELYFIEAVEV